MLIEVHARPAGATPETFAAAVEAAGLDGAIIAVADVEGWADFADAFDDAGLMPFLGLELPLERGGLVFVPADVDDPALDAVDWKGPAGGHALGDALALVAGLEGVLLLDHPYDRTDADVLGDRVYGAKGLAGVVTRTGRGKLSWDTLADAYAEKYGIARLGSGGRRLGAAATVIPDNIETQDGLVSAINAGLSLPVEFDDPADRKDRLPPPVREARPRRDDDRGPRGDRGPRRDRDDRGPRRDDDRGPRGDRGPRRDDDRGGRGRGDRDRGDRPRGDREGGGRDDRRGRGRPREDRP